MGLAFEDAKMWRAGLARWHDPRGNWKMWVKHPEIRKYAPPEIVERENEHEYEIDFRERNWEAHKAHERFCEQYAKYRKTGIEYDPGPFGRERLWRWRGRMSYCYFMQMCNYRHNCVF